MNGKLWGTDFSYSEFRRVAGAFADGTATPAGETAIEGRPAQILRLSPPAGDSEPYDAIRVTVDRRTCVPLQAEFLKGAAVKKVMSAPATGLRQYAGQWYASELTLRDVLAGTRTRLRVTRVTPGARLSASYFHPQQFYSVR